MPAQAVASVKHKESYSFKNALVSGAVVACVVTSGFGVFNNIPTNHKRTKPLDSALVNKPNQTSNIIKVTPISYTKPKQFAEPYVIKRVYMGAKLMDNKYAINQSYFTDKVSDFNLPKNEEEFISFPKKFAFIPEEETSTKFNYSFDEVSKDYNYTSTDNDEADIFEL